MLIHPKDLRRSLNAAAEMTYLYNLYVFSDGGLEKSVPELLRLCREHLGKDIEVNELLEPTEHEAILGHYLKLPDRYVINLQPGLSPDLHRFVLCKELFHIVLDDPDCWTVDLYDHVESAITGFAADLHAGAPVVSEALAEIAAMEFLFPFAHRQQVVQHGGNDFAAIAHRYNIPLIFIEFYLSESLMSYLGALYSAEKSASS